MELNDSSTVSSESSDSDSSSRDGSDSSSSDDGAPTSTAARTAARQRGEHMSGPGDVEDIWEGRTRAQTRALNPEAAARLIGAIGPCDGGRISQALVAAQDAGGEPTKLSDDLVKEAEPEPTAHSVACSSKQFGSLDGGDGSGN